MVCLLTMGTGCATVYEHLRNYDDKEELHTIIVYVDENLPQLKVVEVGEQLCQLDNIQTCEYVPIDESLLKDILSDLSDDGSMFEGLSDSDNFLLNAYRISLKDISKHDETIAEIESLEGVKNCIDYFN